MPFRRQTLSWIAFAIVIVAAVSAVAAKTPAPATAVVAKDSIGTVTKSDAEWKKLLPAESYRVLRKKGTEIAFTGKTWDEHRTGTYACAGCALPLYSSATKFDSGTGWPSFWAPVAANHVRGLPDMSYGGMNTEIVCARCGGHLGHVFDDGPRPTGKRYCMNSAAMVFRAKTSP